MKQTGIFWFSNDLRLHDNPALMRANAMVDELLCVFVIDHQWFAPSKFGGNRLGVHRMNFLQASLDDLHDSLYGVGQTLIVERAGLESSLRSWVEKFSVQKVFRSRNAGWYENQAWERLQKTFPDIEFHTVDSHTLFSRDQLPFDLATMPATFSQFRKAMEGTQCAKPGAPLSYLPPPPAGLVAPARLPPRVAEQSHFNGGESAALNHLDTYFSGANPARYKHVRNALDGWDNSCKLSPWLANGTLSVRETVARLKQYERDEVANESTYWIYFELLWREFFQWYAHKNGTRLYAFKGLKKHKPLTSFYPERFQKWVSGCTPYPLVNACMNELRETGYLSNRGRQIVASCLVNELAIDWRYGASYFEQQLIDYDVASNWGNWQYLAGVGADSKSKRHFNLDKQTRQFDPQFSYISRWTKETASQVLDSVDAADWPIA